MNTKWILLLIVAAISLGLCLTSMSIIRRTADEMDVYRLRVLESLESGDAQTAFRLLSEMASIWDEREPLLQMMVSHEILHEISGLMTEADANLTIGDTDDFYRSMALLGEALSLLYDDERFMLSNIL